MKKMKILVCAHKDTFVKNDKLYIPIQVGKETSNCSLNFQGDNEGDNISKRNESYCELTAHYWAWKNLKEFDIGLCHYRRYFKLEDSLFSTSTYVVSKEDFQNIATNNSLKKIEKYMSQYDIILPKSWRLPWCIKRDFESICNEDYEILARVIKAKHPEYLKSFEKYSLGNRKTGYNMFITSKEVFIGYSKWLFDILFETEKHIKLSPYTYYRRIFGFMSEILLPVYCEKNRLKIKECPIYFISTEDKKNNFLSCIKEKIKNIFNTIAYRLISISRKEEIISKFWENYLKMDKIEIDN